MTYFIATYPAGRLFRILGTKYGEIFLKEVFEKSKFFNGLKNNMQWRVIKDGLVLAENLNGFSKLLFYQIRRKNNKPNFPFLDLFCSGSNMLEISHAGTDVDQSRGMVFNAICRGHGFFCCEEGQQGGTTHLALLAGCPSGEINTVRGRADLTFLKRKFEKFIHFLC